MLERKIRSTGPHGLILIAASEAAEAMSASGTRHTSSSPAISKLSIAACLRMAWAKSVNSSPQQENAKLRAPA